MGRGWICAQHCFCACVHIQHPGQAPWKRQQRSSAFKWIKTPTQSPEPAGIGQTGCSLDQDLRLIISHAVCFFAATVAYLGNGSQNVGICCTLWRRIWYFGILGVSWYDIFIWIWLTLVYIRALKHAVFCFCLLAKNLKNYQVDFGETFRKKLLDVLLQLINFWHQPNSRLPLQSTKFRKTGKIFITLSILLLVRRIVVNVVESFATRTLSELYSLHKIVH